MDEALRGLSGYRRVIDNIVMYDSDVVQHGSHVRQFLHQCADYRITLNINKFKYAQPEVQFAGFVLSAEGYSVDPAITNAIQQFPTPSNRINLRSFFGLANQLSSSTVVVSPPTSP